MVNAYKYTVNKGGCRTKPYAALHSPTLGDQAPYAGVAPVFQGVMAGDMPLIGLGAEPKNMPVAGMEKAKVNQSKIKILLLKIN